MALGAAFGACGPDHPASRSGVIGGTSTSAAAATIGLILLHKDAHGTGLCSGTFIRDDLVVTAAHCFRNMNVVKVLAFSRLDDFTVRPLIGAFGRIEGVLDLTNAAAFPSSNNFLMHPSFAQDDLNRWADIAVVYFAKNTAGTRPNALLATTAPELGSAVLLAGYGETKLGDLSSAGSKHAGTNVLKRIPTLPKAEDGRPLIDQRILNMLRLDRATVVARDLGDAIPGPGDSGGSLYDGHGQLLGTTSFGLAHAFGDVDISAFYTNTTQPEVATFLQSALSSYPKA